MCEKCNPGYGLDPEGNGCVLCNKTGECSLGGYKCVATLEYCQNVSIQKEDCGCYACDPGFGITETRACAACTGNTWSNGTTACLPGPENCVTANPRTGACEVCEAGFEIDLKNNIECTPCGRDSYSEGGDNCIKTSDPGCIETEQTNPTCLQCREGYHKVDGQCLQCEQLSYSVDGVTCVGISNSTHCVRANPAVDACIQCDPGFAPEGNGCAGCLESQSSPLGERCENVHGCKVADPVTGECTTCTVHYGKDEETGRCEECRADQYSVDNKCYDGPANCEESLTGMYYCERCIPGYQPIKGICENCTGNSYSIDGLSCTVTDEHCIMSTHVDANCVQCEAGYGVDSSGVCETCTGNTYSDDGLVCKDGPANCQECERQEPVCKVCHKGHQITDDKTCEPCTGNTYSVDGRNCLVGIDGCKEAVHTEEDVCAECDVGYRYENGNCIKCIGNTWGDGNLECYPGPDNCTEAIHTRFGCQTCKNKFEVDSGALCAKCEEHEWSDGVLCQKGPQNCAQSHAASRKCELCYAGFELVNGDCDICIGTTYSEGLKCVPMENCVLARPGASYYDCLKCSIGYGLEFKKCVKCEGNTYSDDGYACKEGLTYCAEAGNHTCLTCTACVDGYDLVNGECLYHVNPPYFLLIVIGLFGAVAAVFVIMKLACKKDMRKVVRPFQRKVSYYAQLGVSNIMKKQNEKKVKKEKERREKEEREAKENDGNFDFMKSSNNAMNDNDDEITDGNNDVDF